MATFQLSSILEKMTNPDRDFRYMATSDLSAELVKDTFKLDTESEKKVCTMLLKLLLEDSSGDVQGLAVKCLGPLVKKIHENQINELVDKLADQLLKKLDKKSADTREIASMGLKTLVAEIPAKDGYIVVRRLTTRLITALAGEDNPEVKHDCLDIINDLLARFGGTMQKEHEAVQKAVLPHLSNSRANSRKKAIACLGHLSLFIGDKLFVSLVDFLIDNAEKTTKVDLIRTFIQAIGAISRSVGFRLGKFMGKVIPLIVKYSNDPRFKKDDELKENCFQTFESLVLRCPKEISPFLQQIIELSITFISYDPNYDSDQMDTDEEEEEEEEEDDDDYSDDDDMSWKVRRASSKTIAAIISTRPELLQEIYQTVAPVLIARFNEREENVKLDIFSTFRELLKQTAILSKRAGALQDKNPVNYLRPFVGKIVAVVTKQLADKKAKSIKTKIGIFALLRELVSVSDGILTDYVSALVPGVVFVFNDKNSNSTLKSESLLFLRLLLPSHPPKVFHEQIAALSPPVIKSVGDHSYKITAEALRVLSELVKIVRAEGSTFDFKPFIKDYFNVVLSKLKALDADQEVKESAINCTSLLIANLGDQLKAETPECLKILLDRLGNEITRLVTVKAFATIASSNLKIDLSPVLVDTITQLSTFLRQNNRHLKQSSLRTLDVIVKNYGAEPAVAGQLPAVITQLAPLITDSDLHGSHLALNLIVDIVRVHKDSTPIVKEKVFPKVIELIESSLLQGLALESLLVLLSELVKLNTKDFGFDFFSDSLINLTKKKLHKQCTASIAQCIAAICVNANSKQLDTTVSRFIADITKKAGDYQQKLLALLCLGEIGRRINLGNYDNLQSAVVSVFDSSEETSLPTAAAFALGNIAVGNLSKYLPFILQDIVAHPNRQYLLLHSLKEIISRHSDSQEKVKAFQEYHAAVLPLLFKYAESPEEGTRNVVAECLGKLALISPDDIIAKLRDLSASPSPLVRSTVISSVKFSIVEQQHQIDSLLLPSMGTFLRLLVDGGNSSSLSTERTRRINLFFVELK